MFSNFSLNDLVRRKFRNGKTDFIAAALLVVATFAAGTRIVTGHDINTKSA